MKNDAKIIKLPSGATMRLEDPDGQLQKCFRDLFGDAGAGLAVVANMRKQKAKDSKDKRR